MPVPQVAIVGRPNVGKSSLLNWLSHKRISVVDPMAGVTRDRVMYLMHHQDRYFELVDTGGIGIVDVGELTEEIDRQIQTALNLADLIVFVVDGPAGVTALDRQVSQRLRKIDKPKLLVVNKCDSPKLDQPRSPSSTACAMPRLSLPASSGTAIRRRCSTPSPKTCLPPRRTKVTKASGSPTNRN